MRPVRPIRSGRRKTEQMSLTPRARDLLARNATYARDVHEGSLPSKPRRRIAIVTCMDARIDPLAMIGLQLGEGHVIRNAGGVITDDVVRSLCLSQRTLGTREILLVHHTDCGLQNLDEEAFVDLLREDARQGPPWSVQAFTDPYDDVRASMRRLEDDPFVAHTDQMLGFVHDVSDGLLHVVDQSD